MRSRQIPQRAGGGSANEAGSLLQRKCGCGGACDECGKKRLQRSAVSPARAGADVPPSVGDVLRSSGRPLGAETRAAMEGGFAHDFSRVRVHSDRAAMDSARDVGAAAYTVGRHVIAPDAAPSRHSPSWDLLAHELTHVVQQSSMPVDTSSLRVGDPGTAMEHEADRNVARLRNGTRAAIGGGGAGVLQRQTLHEIDIEPVSPDEAKKLKDKGINLPEVSQQTWHQLINRAGKRLRPEERTTIENSTAVKSPSGPAMAFTKGAKFVLHDTQGAIGASDIGRRAGLARGPLGVEGSAAYVPAAGPAVASYPMFERRRVASSQYERGTTPAVGQTQRDALFRAVWKSSSTAQQNAALDSVLTGITFKKTKKLDEKENEKKKARKQLDGTSGDVMTTASWAASALCDAVASSGVAAVAAAPANEPALTDACTKLAPIIASRRERIASSVNIELVQEAATGCDTPAKVDKPLSYTAEQYANLTSLYLRSALIAGEFPEITTHYVVDRGIGDHCDPRCFDLDRLYESIRLRVGHPAPARYGVQPVYGTPGTSATVWWHDPVCGGKHP